MVLFVGGVIGMLVGVFGFNIIYFYVKVEDN